MLRPTIAQALEFHLVPDILRQQGNVRFYWIELRLCLTDSNTPAHRKKRDKLLAETNTADQLKASIIETIVSSQFEFLLAMAYKANSDAKIHDQKRKIEPLGYRFKSFLLNILVLVFAEKFKIADKLAAEGNDPWLSVQNNKENGMNYDLLFFTGFAFSFYSPTSLRRHAVKKGYGIDFHMPKNHVIDPVKNILADLRARGEAPTF